MSIDKFVTKLIKRGMLSVMVIILGNGIGDQSCG